MGPSHKDVQKEEEEDDDDDDVTSNITQAMMPVHVQGTRARNDGEILPVRGRRR